MAKISRLFQVTGAQISHLSLQYLLHNGLCMHIRAYEAFVRVIDNPTGAIHQICAAVLSQTEFDNASVECAGAVCAQSETCLPSVPRNSFCAFRMGTATAITVEFDQTAGRMSENTGSPLRMIWRKKPRFDQSCPRSFGLIWFRCNDFSIAIQNKGSTVKYQELVRILPESSRLPDRVICIDIGCTREGGKRIHI